MNKTFISSISGKAIEEEDVVYAKTLRTSLFGFIQDRIPSLNQQSIISKAELNSFREQYFSDYLTTQLGALTEMEKNVIASITEHSTLAGKLDDEDENQTICLGDRLADKVADFGGSWKFIIIFAFILIVWILLNVYGFKNKGFDPYPFILLNLILSCLAAIQAPIIMMSQNRQEDKDRQRSKKDYMINLKSEVEIHTLQEKLDQLLVIQQKELIEIQKEQVRKMDQLLEILTREK